MEGRVSVVSKRSHLQRDITDFNLGQRKLAIIEIILALVHPQVGLCLSLLVFYISGEGHQPTIQYALLAHLLPLRASKGNQFWVILYSAYIFKTFSRGLLDGFYTPSRCLSCLFVPIQFHATPVPGNFIYS